MRAIAAAGVLLLIALFTRATTPHVTFTDGFGDVDGNSHARMVFELRGAPAEPIRSPYVLTFTVVPPWRAAALAWALLVALHLVATRFASPVAETDREAYLAYSVATISVDRLVAISAVTLPTLVVAALVARLWPRPLAEPRPASLRASR